MKKLTLALCAALALVGLSLTPAPSQAARTKTVTKTVTKTRTRGTAKAVTKTKAIAVNVNHGQVAVAAAHGHNQAAFFLVQHGYQHNVGVAHYGYHNVTAVYQPVQFAVLYPQPVRNVQVEVVNAPDPAPTYTAGASCASCASYGAAYGSAYATQQVIKVQKVKTVNVPLQTYTTCH